VTLLESLVALTLNFINPFPEKFFSESMTQKNIFLIHVWNIPTKMKLLICVLMKNI
jgi:hypothetical protein